MTIDDGDGDDDMGLLGNEVRFFFPRQIFFSSAWPCLDACLSDCWGSSTLGAFVGAQTGKEGASKFQRALDAPPSLLVTRLAVAVAN